MDTHLIDSFFCFSHTVHCSFALAQIIQLGIEVQGEKPEFPSTLKSEGILRTEMRFAKGQVYIFFTYFLLVLSMRLIL